MADVWLFRGLCTRSRTTTVITNGQMFAHVPVSERLVTPVAAAEFAHLLEEEVEDGQP